MLKNTTNIEHHTIIDDGSYNVNPTVHFLLVITFNIIETRKHFCRQKNPSKELIGSVLGNTCTHIEERVKTLTVDST